MNIINFWQAEFHNTIFIIFVSIQGSPQGLHEGGAREEGMGSIEGDLLCMLKYCTSIGMLRLMVGKF